jgi:hypothetical protein
MAQPQQPQQQQQQQQQQRGAAAPEGRPASGEQAPQGALLSTQNVLLGLGTASLLGMFYFYRKKQTVPFKTCWAIM